MLTDKRIKEAKNNVRRYLSEGLLSKASFDRQVFSVLENNANESLNVAEILYKGKHSWLWVIVTSYFTQKPPGLKPLSPAILGRLSSLNI